MPLNMNRKVLKHIKMRNLTRLYQEILHLPPLSLPSDNPVSKALVAQTLGYPRFHIVESWGKLGFQMSKDLDTEMTSISA
jgi:hypothetical protein